MKWNKIKDSLPKLKPVRNQTGELIGEASEFCVVFGNEALTVDYYIKWDSEFRSRNEQDKLQDGWANAKFDVTHWMKVNKPK